MKKFLSVSLILSLMCLFMIPSAFAAKPASDTLTKKEKQILTSKVGMSEYEIGLLPVSELRMLIKRGAKKVASGGGNHSFENGNSGGISTMALKKGSDINLWAVGYSVTSSISGKKEFIIYGNYKWLKSPDWELTDGITLGWPDNAGFTLDFNSYGDPKGFSSKYCYKPDNYAPDVWTCESEDTSPEDWTNGTGVAQEIDLDANPSNHLHSGYIQQHIFVDSSKTGSANIKFTYGHKILSGSVSFDMYPVAGVSISPSFTQETASFGFTLNY